MTIWIDGDACPVKEETYKVAYRTKTPVIVVSGQYLRVPMHPLISARVAGDAFDAADDVIEAECGPGDVVVTADILLAQRVLEKGAACLDPRGTEFTAAAIGNAVATRNLMADIRSGLEGHSAGGPKAFSARDRSNYLNGLDRLVTRAQRAP